MMALGKQITSCGNQESIIWECALKSCCSGPVLFCTWLVQSHDSWVRMNPLLPPFRIICSFVVLNVHVVHILFLQIACWSATLLVALPKRAPSSSLYPSLPLPLSLFILRSCLTSALQTIWMIPRRFLTISGCFFGCHKSYDFFNVISFILPATPASPCPASSSPSHTPRKLAHCWCW